MLLASSLALWLVAIPAVSDEAKAPELAVSVALPSGHGQRIEYRRPGDHFHVIVSNRSKTPLRICQEWCSWGYASLSFEMEDEGGKKWVAKKRLADFTRNFPSTWTVAPQRDLVVDVYWGNEDTWEGFPPFGTEARKLRMRAVFEIKSDADTKEHGVWTGRVVSEVQEVLFSKWTPTKD